MFVTYICIYLSSKKYFKYRKTTLFFNIMFYVSIIIGILGVLQRHINYSNLNPIFNKNICSTFGHSNFFGSYMVMQTLLVGYMYLYNQKKLYLLIYILFGIALFIAESTGPVLQPTFRCEYLDCFDGAEPAESEQ